MPCLPGSSLQAKSACAQGSINAFAPFAHGRSSDGGRGEAGEIETKFAYQLKPHAAVLPVPTLGASFSTLIP